MKAERLRSKQEFVPVVVTLESQEEVNALFAVLVHRKVTNALPTLREWWRKLSSFESSAYHSLFDKFSDAIS